MTTHTFAAAPLKNVLAAVEANPALKPDALAELDARAARPTTSDNKAQRIARVRAKIVAIGVAPTPTTPAPAAPAQPASEDELVAKYMAMPMNRLAFAAKRARKPEVKAAIEHVMAIREGAVREKAGGDADADMVKAIAEWLAEAPRRKTALAAAIAGGHL